MKRWIVVLLAALLLIGSVAAVADPIHIGGGPMTMSSSPIHIGGGPIMLTSSPIHIGGGPFAY